MNGHQTNPITHLTDSHTLSSEEVYQKLRVSPNGLKLAEAKSRLDQFGPNELPQPKTPGLGFIFFRQFRSPLIYILLVAAVVSFFLKEFSDAAFIFLVLLVNATIGTVQEFARRMDPDFGGRVLSFVSIRQGADRLDFG